MGGGIRIGRLFGIPVSVNPSVLAIAALLTWSLAAEELPALAGGAPVVMYWLAAVVVAVLFLASLMAHEGAHAVVAQRHGVRVTGLSLWLFGGVAWLGGEAPDPRADLRIAAAGPATSIALSLVFGATSAALDVAGAPSLVVAAAGWLATINVVLAVFNLAPAAPLDGGRVLRALLWRRSGDRDRAALTAARAGRAFGALLVAIGVVEIVLGFAVGGLWFVFLGWFIRSAATQERNDAAVRRKLRGLFVADAAKVWAPWETLGPSKRAPITVSPTDTLIAVRDRMAVEQTDVAVVVDRGVPVGMLKLDDIVRFSTRREAGPHRMPDRPPPPPPPWPGMLTGRR